MQEGVKELRWLQRTAIRMFRRHKNVPAIVEAVASSSSEWDKLSSPLSSSASSSDDDEDGEWCIVKNKKPKPKEDVDQDQEEDDGINDDDDMCGFYNAEESDGGESTVMMKELLSTYLPELAANDRFSFDYIEQHVFPHLPAKTLLRLRHASGRWADWISSPFFVHIHSLTSRALSGFFFHDSAGSPSFASLVDADSVCSLPDPSLSFLPEPVLVKASTHGLLCCRGRETLDYYVCNPITAKWAAIPATADQHGPDTAVVIVMREPLTYNFDADYFLACAYEIFEGVYGFETFSSENWEWRKSKKIVAAECMVPGSGVAVAGVAYWRTTMQTVVAFDPVADTWQEVHLAEEVAEAAAAEQWEIGEMGRKLCVVCAGPRVAEVRVWEGGSGWMEAGEIAASEDMVPLRAQGEREAAVWDGGRRTVTARDMERGTERKLAADSDPGYCADFLPYASTLVQVKSGSQDLGSYSEHGFRQRGKRQQAI